MGEVTIADLRKLYIPPPNSHKGENGRLLIVGGSRLFHAAGLWAAEIASKIVDLVFFSSVPINLKTMEELKIKGLFRNGIVVPREELESYLTEADCVLIGPGMVRKTQISNLKSQSHNLNVKTLEEIGGIKDEGEQTRALVEYLLKKYPKKRWVIDGGALQEMKTSWIPKKSILTPHRREFERLFLPKQLSEQGKIYLPARRSSAEGVKNRGKFTFQQDDRRGRRRKIEAKIQDLVRGKAKEYNCVILLKGRKDFICSTVGRAKQKHSYGHAEDVQILSGNATCKIVRGGNAGMTKGGTGDVLAGLVAAFYCKNEPFLSACAASFLNKKAGEALFERQGYFFNASDLLAEIPQTMKKLLV